MSQITPEQILQVLKTVKDPDLHRDIVSLGFIKNIEIQNGTVKFNLELTTPACPVKDQLKQECESKIKSLAGVSNVEISMTSQVRSRSDFGTSQVLPRVRNIVAIASGKGGVGKSTVTANLALALAKTGAKVGLMDCDVYGPSMPLMFGLVGKQPQVTPEQKILPLAAHGISLMSIGFLSNEKTPVIWRGPMVHQILQQFLTRVEWGELDYLLLDLPPGTGDAQLTLTQTAAISGAVIVTTPQEVSLIDARKGLQMFEKVNVPVLGLIENMSYFSCPDCHKVVEIFKRGGGEKMSEELGVPLLGEIPIDPEIVQTGDEGKPIVMAKPDSQSAKIYQMIAGAVAAQLSIVHMQAGADSKIDLKWQTNKS